MAGPAPLKAGDAGFGTPWAEQIAFLRDKLRLPTEAWDDISHGAHDRAFIVAGAQKADLLADLHQAVAAQMESGRGERAFTQVFKDLVTRNGWTGWTGEGTAKGTAWRAGIIYQTNMSTSYAAGRYRQLSDPGLLKLRPYWQYHHADGVLNPRPQHQAWDGLTLRHDHPFWKTHFAPNGWRCHCWVSAVAKPPAGAPTEPPEGWDEVDPATGVPVGIDKGFGYAPGAAADTSLRQIVRDKLISYPPAIAKALAADVNRYIEANATAAEFARAALADGGIVHPAWLGFVEQPAALQPLLDDTDVTGWFVTLPASTPRHVQTDHAFDGKGQRPPQPADYDRVAAVLNDADTLRAGHVSDNGHATVVAVKRIGSETFRAVFEALPGKRNRALALISLVIKTR